VHLPGFVNKYELKYLMIFLFAWWPRWLGSGFKLTAPALDLTIVCSSAFINIRDSLLFYANIYVDNSGTVFFGVLAPSCCSCDFHPDASIDRTLFYSFGTGSGFATHFDGSDDTNWKVFNWHPVLMVTAYVFCAVAGTAL